MSFYPTGIKNSKKIAKKFKISKNTIMASSQAKRGWERPRKGENRKNRSMSSYLTRNREFQKKKAKKFKKVKTPLRLLFKQK